MFDAPDRPTPESENEVERVPAKKRGGGPRTQEGKESSRRNSMKHGLRAKVLLPDDLVEAVARRTAELAGEFAPETPYQEWLVGEMALATAKLDRCAELTIADLRRCVDRASLCWDEDRRKLAEDLGARLARDPARVAQALTRSRHGVDWLVERWEGLGEALAANGGWDEAQRRLASDLLGVAPELRNGSGRVPAEADAEGLAELVERQVGRLLARREESLDALDEAERGMAMAGMPLDEDPATARVRRYEATCRRALLSARAELLRSRAEPAAAGSQGQGEEPLSPSGLPLSEAASIWLAKRSGTAFRTLLADALEAGAADIEPSESDDSPAEADIEPSEGDESPEEAVAAAPAAVARPAAAGTVTVNPLRTLPAGPPMNRHDRRARESLARRSAHRDARGAGPADPAR